MDGKATAEGCMRAGASQRLSLSTGLQSFRVSQPVGAPVSKVNVCVDTTHSSHSRETTFCLVPRKIF